MPKTINDIIPPSRRKAMELEREATITDIPVAPTPPPPPPMFNDDKPPAFPRASRNSQGGGFPFGILIGIVVVIALSVGALYAFAGAKVEITPVVNETSVSGEFAATASTGDLPFELIVVDSIASAAIPAEGTTNANDPAQGSLTVYNGQTKPQQLIKNTRFESPTGLIYRIRDSITVPAGSVSAPGELKVTVYADEGGEQYNIPASTFTVPGLKGSATYELVYARSEEAMMGGFSGERPSVSQSTKDAQYESLKPTLSGNLNVALQEKVAEGYILLPGASWTVFEPQQDESESAGTVNVREKGTVTAVVFPKDALAKAIAYRTVGVYAGQPVTLGEGSLTLSPVEGKAPEAGAQNFAFNLSGDTSIVWQIDTAKVAGAVAGKNRDAAKTILAGFPEVEQAILVLRPFWSSTYPADPAEIEVTVETPKSK